MRKYLIIPVILLCFESLLKAQSDDDSIKKMNFQLKLYDFIGCIQTADNYLSVAKNKGEVYYFRSRSEFLLGDFKGAEQDMHLAAQYGYKIEDVVLRKSINFWLDENAKLKYFCKQYYKKVKVFPELGYRPKYTRKDSLRGALRPERTCFDVTFYNLNLKIDPVSKQISGFNDITFKVVGTTHRIQIDLFPQFKIDGILWNGQNLKFTREFNAVFVIFPTELPLTSMQTIRVNYSGKPEKALNPPWEGGFVWKKDKENNWWCGVACEQLGASSWWPNKDHPSDEPDSMLLTFSVPNGYGIVSNGRFRSSNPDGKDFTSQTWFVSDPINNYNATFYMGKFAHFNDTMTNSQGKYPLDYYVLPFNLTIAKTIFAQTREVLKFYESAFGDYPFMNEKFSLVEAPFEGMEHQTAIAYGNGYDKNEKTHEYQNHNDDYIIVHETAHEWWGNSVTASDMADIWIQEGFATYAELLFLEHKYGKTEYLTQTVVKLNQIFNLWPVVQNYNVNENAFISNDCYNKGAATLHNLRCCINNDSLFFKILKDFALKYKLKIVTTQNFIDMVNNYTGQNYTPFFKKYLYEKDLPVLNYAYKKENGEISIHYHWDGVGKDFKMPFCIASGGKSFRLEGTTSDSVVVLKNAETFHFYNIYVSTENVQPNSLTYYWTKCTNNAQ